MPRRPRCALTESSPVGTAESCEVDSKKVELPFFEPTDSPLLSDHTTFRLGGAADQFVIAHTTEELVTAVAQADEAGIPVLVLSGGSNMLCSDEGFPGRVILVATRGVSAEVSDCGGAVVRVAAGENWDSLVNYAIQNEWVGIEALSGIPGLVGSTPVQNVGAYGAEVSQTIYQVRTYDRLTKQYKTFANADCHFDYRDSIFKQSREVGQATGRYVILEVTFQFPLGTLGAPIAYAELARSLGVEVGQRAPMTQVRETVLALRRGKGMVVESQDHDTWSAGSFFMNPILTAEEADALPPEAPRFGREDGLVKTSAAWLIDHAGFPKGYSCGGAGISGKHVLALTNRGSASSADVVALAREITAGVQEKFRVKLTPEPVFIGFD